MFDISDLIEQCRRAVAEADPRAAVRELLLRLLERPSAVAEVLGRDEGGMEVLYNAPDLTVVNAIWAPHMTIYPHDHRMWATIGVYGGVEANTLYRRGPERIQPAGGRLLEAGDEFSLGPDAIHDVANPRAAFTGAVHVYGGGFVKNPAASGIRTRYSSRPTTWPRFAVGSRPPTSNGAGNSTTTSTRRRSNRRHHTLATARRP